MRVKITFLGVVLLVLCLVPFPKELTDDDSIQYKAVLHSVTDIKMLNTDGTY